MSEGDIKQPEQEKPRPLRVVVAVPVEGHVEIGMAWSLARATAHFAAIPYDGEKAIQVEFIEGSMLPEMRRRLVARALHLEATHIMWLDSDMKFPPDTIARLLNHNLPVVCANYPRKNIEAKPTAYLSSDDYVGSVWSGENATGIQEVTMAGMGCMLTHVDVFDKVKPPIFSFVPQGPDFVKDMGEDVYFCQELYRAGIPIYVDHDLSKQVAHIGKMEYTNAMSKEAEVVKQAMYRDLGK